MTRSEKENPRAQSAIMPQNARDGTAVAVPQQRELFVG
jgi:hypothetical protein